MLLLKQHLNLKFPKLKNEDYNIVGDFSQQYNCIAYAAGDTSRRWDSQENYYWPDYATRTSSIESLKQVFFGIGYEQCNDNKIENGYKKIALYELKGCWTHAAIQMTNGYWRSKLGDGPIIEHKTPQSLSGKTYGKPTIYMKIAIEN